MERVKVNLSDIEIPEFKKKRAGFGYIEFGDKNAYPDFLGYLYNKSPKHRAIINGKIKYIFGNGFDADEGTEMYSFAKNNESTLKKCISDIEIFGGFYLEIILTLNPKFTIINHIPFRKVRRNKNDDGWVYKKDWKDHLEKMVEFEDFISNPYGNKKKILAYREYNPFTDIYALPGYISAINYIESDISISKTLLTTAKSGFSARKMITQYNGEPTKEQKSEIYNKFKDKFTGEEGDRFILNFLNDPSLKPTIDDLGSSDLTNENFSNVDSLICDNIFTAHEVTHPLLFGIQQEGKLGNSQELKVAYEIFNNTYINNKQKQISKIFTILGNFLGYEGECYINTVTPVGIEITSDMIKESLSKDEIREILGYDPEGYVNGEPANDIDVNQNLQGLKGKDMIHIKRVVRDHKANKISRGIAEDMLGAYGLTKDNASKWLDFNTQEKEYNDDDFVNTLQAFGYEKESFKVLFSQPATFDENEEGEMLVMQSFKDAPKAGAEATVAEGGGSQITLPKYKIMYTYEKRSDAPGAVIKPTSRLFCRRLVERDKMYTRADIQSMSAILGYNVFSMAGGYWNNNGSVQPHCRHFWKANIVLGV